MEQAADRQLDYSKIVRLIHFAPEIKNGHTFTSLVFCECTEKLYVIFYFIKFSALKTGSSRDMALPEDTICLLNS